VKLKCLATLSLWLILTVPASPQNCLPAGLLYISTGPECPGIGDSIMIYTDGGFPDACWSTLDFDSVAMTANQINIYAGATHVDGTLCTGVQIHFFFDVPVGILAPDSYSVSVIASIVSDSGYLTGTYVCDSSFYVAGMGDPNGNGSITSADVIRLVNYVFKSGTVPCGQSGDVNCDTVLTASDIIFLVAYVFRSGPAPPASCSS